MGRNNIRQDIANNRQNRGGAGVYDRLDDIVDEFINIADDGIERVPVNAQLNNAPHPAAGYLIIKSDGGGKLLAFEHNGTYWGVKVNKGKLEIRKLDGSNSTWKTLGGNGTGSNYGDKEVRQFLNDQADTATQSGIATRGFKGFQSGYVQCYYNDPNDPNFNNDCKLNIMLSLIPMSKYRLQAWMLDSSSGPCAHVDCTIIVFNGDRIVVKQNIYNCKVKTTAIKDNNNEETYLMANKPTKFYYFSSWLTRLTAWFQAKIFRLQSKGMLLKINTTTVDKETKLNLTLKPQNNVNAEIHYSIERLWEGEDWVK